MPTDMFGRTTILGGVMSAEATRLSFTQVQGISNEGAGLIVQQLNIGYTQNVTRLYALEDAKVYFVAGRTEGQWGFQHVIGPAGLQQEFITAYGNVCGIKDKEMVLSMLTGCNVASNNVVTGNKSAVRLMNPVITSMSLQMQAGNMVIASGLQGLFVAMLIQSVGGGNFAPA